MNWFNMILILITYATCAVAICTSIVLTYRRMQRQLTLGKQWAPTMLLLNTLIVQNEGTDLAMLGKLLLSELDPHNCPKSYKDEVMAFRKTHGLDQEIFTQPPQPEAKA